MRRGARTFAVTLAIGLAVAGCSAPAAESTATPSPGGTPGGTTSASPSPSPSVTPTPAPSTAAPVGWTSTQLTAACVDFQAGWAEGEGYAADDFDWTSPASTQENGGTWYVFLQGTFTTPDGDAVPAEYSCAVTGTPDDPTVTQTASE
jgi:hypothetical protein